MAARKHLRTIAYNSRINQFIFRDFNGIVKLLAILLQLFVVESRPALKLKSVQCGWKGTMNWEKGKGSTAETAATRCKATANVRDAINALEHFLIYGDTKKVLLSVGKLTISRQAFGSLKLNLKREEGTRARRAKLSVTRAVAPSNRAPTASSPIKRYYSINQ